MRVGDPTTAGGDATDPAAGATAVGAEVPFAALSLEARVDRTARLARIGATDLGRWRDGRNLQPQWHARAAHAARHVPPGAHVLDLGAGAQALRDLLPAGCRYTPSDLLRLRRVRDLIARGVPTAEAARQVLQDEAIGLQTISADPAVRRLAAAAAQLDGPALRHLLDHELGRRGVVDTWQHLAKTARPRESGPE